MPTNYDGVPGATQSPSSPPGPGVSPRFALPADGDNRNGATWAQMGKVAADFLAWLTDPFGISGSWAQRVWGVQNARLQRKWYLDHMGHPAGRIVKWTEEWPANYPTGDNQNGPGGPTAFTHLSQVGWVATVTMAGSGPAFAGVAGFTGVNLPSTKLSNLLRIDVGATVGDYSLVARTQNQIFSADNSIAMEGDVWPGALAVAQSQIVWGFGGMPTAGLIGGMFYTDGSANWKCVCGDGSTLSAAVDTGVAVAGTAWQQLRVEWWGANVADNSASAMRFYIGGVLKATITTNLPTGQGCSPNMGAKKLSGSALLTSFFGVVQFSSNY